MSVTNNGKDIPTAKEKTEGQMKYHIFKDWKIEGDDPRSLFKVLNKLLSNPNYIESSDLYFNPGDIVSLTLDIKQREGDEPEDK